MVQLPPVCSLGREIRTGPFVGFADTSEDHDTGLCGRDVEFRVAALCMGQWLFGDGSVPVLDDHPTFV